jgi:hypothetical protein
MSRLETDGHHIIGGIVVSEQQVVCMKILWRDRFEPPTEVEISPANPLFFI